MAWRHAPRRLARDPRPAGVIWQIRGSGGRSRPASRRWASGRRRRSAWSGRRGLSCAYSASARCGSSTICSSAPMITSSGLPVSRIRSVQRLFVDVVLDAGRRFVVGGVGHPLDVLDEGVGDVEAGGEGDPEAVADGEVGLDRARAPRRSPGAKARPAMKPRSPVASCRAACRRSTTRSTSSRRLLGQRHGDACRRASGRRPRRRGRRAAPAPRRPAPPGRPIE